MSLHLEVANALEAERIVVPVNDVLHVKAHRAAEWAVSQGMDERTAARWGAVRVTQSIPLAERAKRV